MRGPVPPITQLELKQCRAILGFESTWEGVPVFCCGSTSRNKSAHLCFEERCILVF
jgi:hypothetical protein